MTNQITPALSKDSDQPEHEHCLNKVITELSMCSYGSKLSLCQVTTNQTG